MEIKDFCTKDTPEREKIGGHRGGCLGKKGNKKRAIATNCYSPFGCHYLQDIMRVLFQTGSIVNVFSKTNTLSEDFVHCLPRDGSFPKLKKLNFCNFSAHLSAPAKPHSFSLSGFTSTATSPLILPHELPNVHPFRAQQTFPLISPCILPANCPCRGMARGRNPGKIRVILAKYSDFMDRLSPFLEPFKGDSREIFGGDDRVFVRLSFEESPSLGRIFGG